MKKGISYYPLFIIFIILFCIISNPVFADEDENSEKQAGDTDFSMKYYFMKFDGGDYFYSNNSAAMNGILLHGDLWLHSRGAFEIEYFTTTGSNGPLGFNYNNINNGPANFNMSLQNFSIGNKIRVSNDEFLSDFSGFINYRWLNLSRNTTYFDDNNKPVNTDLDFSGFGFGFKKEHASWRKFDVYGQLAYYPNLSGAAYDLQALTYEVGFSAKLSDNFLTTVGYRGESFSIQEGNNTITLKDYYLFPKFRTDGITAGLQLQF